MKTNGATTLELASDDLLCYLLFINICTRGNTCIFVRGKTSHICKALERKSDKVCQI